MLWRVPKRRASGVAESAVNVVRFAACDTVWGMQACSMLMDHGVAATVREIFPPGAARRGISGNRAGGGIEQITCPVCAEGEQIERAGEGERRTWINLALRNEIEVHSALAWNLHQ